MGTSSTTFDLQAMLAPLREHLSTNTDFQGAQALLVELQRTITSLEQEQIQRHAPAVLHAALRERVEGWINGELDIAAAPPLNDDQIAELRALLAKTRFTAVKVKEVEADLTWSDLSFSIGDWKGSSNRQYSFGRERSWSTISSGEDEVYSSSDLAVHQRGFGTAMLKTIAAAIPTTLPKNALLLYLVLVAFDAEVLSPWAPWIYDLELD